MFTPASSSFFAISIFPCDAAPIKGVAPFSLNVSRDSFSCIALLTSDSCVLVFQKKVGKKKIETNKRINEVIKQMVQTKKNVFSSLFYL